MIDHLIVVTSDLFATRDRIAETTGVEGTYGGGNPVNGTHNVLYPLGGISYLELLAADESGRAGAQRGLPFGLETLAGHAVAGWSAQVADLDVAVTSASGAGAPLGALVEMSRTRPDGVKLEWRMTYPREGDLEQLCPFLIDWGASEHPSVTLRSATHLALVEFTTLTTEPDLVGSWLAALGLLEDVSVERADRNGFRIEVRGPSGTVSFSEGTGHGAPSGGDLR